MTALRLTIPKPLRWMIADIADISAEQDDDDAYSKMLIALNEPWDGIAIEMPAESWRHLLDEMERLTERDNAAIFDFPYSERDKCDRDFKRVIKAEKKALAELAETVG